MKILKILIAIFLLALVAATAVSEEENTPSFLQTTESNALANQATITSDEAIKRIQGEFKAALLAIKPDAKLPF